MFKPFVWWWLDFATCQNIEHPLEHLQIVCLGGVYQHWARFLVNRLPTKMIGTEDVDVQGDAQCGGNDIGTPHHIVLVKCTRQEIAMCENREEGRVENVVLGIIHGCGCGCMHTNSLL